MWDITLIEFLFKLFLRTHLINIGLKSSKTLLLFQAIRINDCFRQINLFLPVFNRTMKIITASDFLFLFIAPHHLIFLFSFRDFRFLCTDLVLLFKLFSDFYVLNWRILLCLFFGQFFLKFCCFFFFFVKLGSEGFKLVSVFLVCLVLLSDVLIKLFIFLFV